MKSKTSIQLLEKFKQEEWSNKLQYSSTITLLCCIIYERQLWSSYWEQNLRISRKFGKGLLWPIVGQESLSPESCSWRSSRRSNFSTERGSSCGRWVRRPAVRIVLSEFSWTRWFLNWVSVEVWTLRVSESTLIPFSINSDETPVKVSLVPLVYMVWMHRWYFQYSGTFCVLNFGWNRYRFWGSWNQEKR